MPAKRIAKFEPIRSRQGGAALLVLLVILVVALAAVLLKSLSTSAINAARQENTSAALAQAKDALLGRAVSDDTIPGSLPCPDTNDDGSAELFVGNHCPSYIGRLPWKTLGLPDLRDGSGERLWYALSPAFRDDNSAQPLNSNTKGTLLVYQADGVTSKTQAGYDAVAVIFAPGSPLSTGNPLRTQTRSTVAQQNNAANYLDGANNQDNTTSTSTSAGPFIAGAKSNTFNDQLLYITTRDLMPLVEQRVASHVKLALTSYFNANGYYPWADSIPSTTDYNSNKGLNRGWLPDDATTPGPASASVDWAAGSFPPWFFANQWYSLIYYSVAKNYSRDTLVCTSCVSNLLSVDGSNARVLFFMPGTPIGTLVRTITTLSDYLEDTQNKDDANDLYVTPASQDNDRDRLYWLSSTGIWKP